jgi:hypothetical protein
VKQELANKHYSDVKDWVKAVRVLVDLSIPRWGGGH